MSCKNFEFCQNETILEIDSEFCMTCGSWFKGGFGWDALTFIDVSDECIICMNLCKRKIMFPTKCGHSFCIPCSYNLLIEDKTKYHLSPVPYGCPPCPNGCDNPIEGTQCYCEEYDDIINIYWGIQKSEEFIRWANAETVSLAQTTYGKGVCPLCRNKYVRD